MCSACPFLLIQPKIFAKGMVLSSFQVNFLQLTESSNPLTKLCLLHGSTSAQAGSKYQSPEVKTNLCQLDIQACQLEAITFYPFLQIHGHFTV